MSKIKLTEITSEKETLLEFPCEFAVKALGRNEPDFHEIVFDIVRKHCPDIEAECTTIRPSKTGKWLAVTVTITATSKNQLDAIYMELTAHERITMGI